MTVLWVKWIFWTPFSALGSSAQLFTTSFLAIVWLLPEQMRVFRKRWMGSTSKAVFSFCHFSLSEVHSLFIEVSWLMKWVVRVKTGFYKRRQHVEIYGLKCCVSSSGWKSCIQSWLEENSNSAPDATMNESDTHQHNYLSTVCASSHDVQRLKCQIQYQWDVQSLWHHNKNLKRSQNINGRGFVTSSLFPGFILPKRRCIIKLWTFSVHRTLSI